MEAASVKDQRDREYVPTNDLGQNHQCSEQEKETYPKVDKENEEYVEVAQGSMTSHKRKLDLLIKEQSKKLKVVDRNDPLTFSSKRKKLEASSDCNMQKSNDFCLYNSRKVNDSEDHDGLVAGWPNHSHKLESKLKDLKSIQRKHRDRKKKSCRSNHLGSERSQKSNTSQRFENLKSLQSGWKVLDNKLSSEKWEITDSGRLSPDSEFNALHSVGYQMKLLRKDNWSVSSYPQTRDSENGIKDTKSKHSSYQEVTDEVGSEKGIRNNRGAIESTLDRYNTTSSRTLQHQEFMESPSCVKQMSSHGSTDSLMDPDNIQVYSQDEDEGDDGRIKFSLCSTSSGFRKDHSEPRPLRRPRSMYPVTDEHQVSQSDGSAEALKFSVKEERKSLYGSRPLHKNVEMVTAFCTDSIESQERIRSHGLEHYSSSQESSVSPADGNSAYRCSSERNTEGGRDTSKGVNRIQHSIKVGINRKNRYVTPTEKGCNLKQEDNSSSCITPTHTEHDQFSLNDVYAVQNYSARVGNRETADNMHVNDDYSSSCSTPVKDEVSSDVETNDIPVVYSQRTPTAYSNESSTLNSLGDFGSVMPFVPRSVQQKHGGAFSSETFQRRLKSVRSLQESSKKTEANTKSYDSSVSPVSRKGHSKSEWPRASLLNDKKSRRSLPAECLSWRREQADFKPSWRTHFSKQCSYNVETFENRKFKVGFIDTHCHLDFLFRRLQYEKSFTDFKDRCEGDDKFPPSFEGCIAIFCEARTFHKITWWTDFLNEPGVWAAFGCHPHFADQYDEEAERYLRMALFQSKTVALGEIGLDYSNKNSQSTKLQKRVFKKQIKIALEMKKPLVIHCRDAHEDCLKIMKKKVPKDYLIHRHCFTGDWEEASSWLQTFSNVYLGFTPLITSNSHRAVNLRDVASKMPLNRLLLETDSPYFRPHCLSSGLRSSSHPGMAIHVAAQVAALRSLDLEEVLVQVRENTRKMYNI